MGKRPKEKREKKRKMVRERRKRKAMTKLFVVTQPRHFVLHIPNTPPHHHLCSRKKGQEEIDCVSSKKKPQSNARNARPIPIKNDRTSVIKRKKIQSKRWCFLSNNKTKNESFLPPLKTDEKKQKFPLKNR